MPLGPTNRREFIAALGSAAVWPLVARGQEPARMRRIGVLSPYTADDAEGQARLTAFAQGLQQLGWTDGRNVRIMARWAAGNADNFREYAAELVALGPDSILATTTPAVLALQQATHTVPIVFVQVTDPVGQGVIASLARPGGNITGFTFIEFPIIGKRLEMLKEVAPGVRRVAVLRDLTIGTAQYMAAIQAVAPSLGVELSEIDVRDAGEIESAVTVFARSPNGGLIVTASTSTHLHRQLIFMLAARYRLPAVYPFTYFVREGGLISYDHDVLDEYRRAAGYVDRILKGEKPADLPVQQPTKLELAINLKTAKALGLTVPPALLARADEVIE